MKQQLMPYPATQPVQGVNVFVPKDADFLAKIDAIENGLRTAGFGEDAYRVSQAKNWGPDAWPAAARSVDADAYPEENKG